jgi:hypothetical protein
MTVLPITKDLVSWQRIDKLGLFPCSFFIGGLFIFGFRVFIRVARLI